MKGVYCNVCLGFASSESAFTSGFTKFSHIYERLADHEAIPLCNFAWKPPRPVRKRTDKKISFRPVSKVELERYFKSIKRNKSTGIDNLPPCLLRDAAHTISAPLTHLINLSLQKGLFPNYWKLAKIVLISICLQNFTYILYV